tara:strand:+ start:683 stop:1987 length:1305 start_codon:yes stop_codon:yes gene_type:complete
MNKPQSPNSDFQKVSNKRITASLLIFLELLISTSSFADSNIGACTTVTDSKSLLRCAIENHPDVLQAKRSLDQSIKKQELASQIPNPQLSGRTLFGQSLGDSIVETEVSLVQPIFIGGTISSRVEQTEAQSLEIGAQVLSQKEKAARLTVGQIHRTRQLNVELEITNETIETFNKILKQFRSKVTLSPEQKASLNVFEMVRSDFILRRSQMLREKEQISLFFNISTGIQFSDIQKFVPNSVSWPNITFPTSKEDLNQYSGSALQIPRMDLKVAQATHELAKSNSWPTIRVGPSFSFNQQGGVRYPNYGFSLSFDLPIFNVNGGGRSYTRAGIARAEGNLEMKVKNLSAGMKQLIKNYTITVDALKNASSMSTLTSKHHKLESLFIRGLISPALVIEAHRQMLDYAINKHSQEQRALELLWTLYAIRGTIMEETP